MNEKLTFEQWRDHYCCPVTEVASESLINRLTRIHGIDIVKKIEAQRQKYAFYINGGFIK